jgi:hypothetical protein
MHISRAQSDMTYGFTRVWTDAQDQSNQVAQPKAAGCAVIFRKKFRGANAEQWRLKRLPAKRADGDARSNRRYRSLPCRTLPPNSNAAASLSYAAS